MTAPLPPEPPKKSGKKIEFDNPEKHQTKKKLYQEIRQTLLNLRISLPYTNHREIIMQFIGVINPGKMGGDVTRLPYESPGPKARNANKIECVFALVSWMIQLYWNYCSDDMIIGKDIAIKEIKKLLEQLQQITKNGLGQYQVVGGVRNGFNLENEIWV